ncbi:MAG: GNAT family N-acetyltransferase [Cereibacter changlensis]
MTSRLRPLERADAARLAALITGYRAAMGAGGSATSEPEARRLIASAEADANILLIGAEAGAGLAGFALAFDLAEIISGRRAGQLDDLFVAPQARGAGLARALIARLTEIGAVRGWAHLRWLVPQENTVARRLYETLAEPAPWDSFRITLAEPPQSRSIL